jgi:hypothetical protein
MSFSVKDINPRNWSERKRGKEFYVFLVPLGTQTTQEHRFHLSMVSNIGRSREPWPLEACVYFHLTFGVLQFLCNSS